MRRWIIFFILQFFFLAGVAQTTVTIDDAVDERDLMAKDLKMFIDSTSQIPFSEITTPPYAGKFTVNSTYQNTDFRENAAYWIRIPIRHSPYSKKVWLLEFYDQTIDHIDAFIPREDGTFEKISMGDQQAFSKRLLKHKNFEVVLRMQADTVVNYYFRVQSHEFADIRVGVRSVNRFVFYALNEYFLFGTLYGMVIIIALYNFLVFLAIREIKNIYYIMYILSVAAYAMSYDGIGFQYLWPNHPEWNNYAVGFTLYSVILWGLIFTRRFLVTRANARGLDRALYWAIIIRSVYFLFEVFLFPKLLTIRTIEIIPLSLIFYTGITVWNRGYRPARFFVIAYGILFTGFFIRTLVYLNVLPFTTPLHYSLHFSFVLEMLFLTFALGDRIRILKNMRDRALKRIIHQHEVNMKLKDKVTSELEEKVTERTIELNKKNAELEATNQKLARQSTEINQINSILDLDNWKLKNSLKEVLNERLMEKTMDYKQFQTLYTDSLACYRFLETLKWGQAYHCRKCANEKYFDGSHKFARRCTRCGYNESITAFTIFHSIKFPIEKAFYIAYLSVTGKKEYTLEKLAHDLDLRVNTVWGFKHKVTERITELEKHGRKPTVSRWEDVILFHEDSPSRASQKNSKPIRSEA
jgi:hypothetical protein